MVQYLFFIQLCNVLYCAPLRQFYECFNIPKKLVVCYMLHLSREIINIKRITMTEESNNFYFNDALICRSHELIVHLISFRVLKF